MRQRFLNLESDAGFTLIEMLLVLATMAILGGLSIPLALPYVLQNDLDISTGITAQSLRRAQSLAMSMQGDSPWGVEMEPQTITLFKGQTFNSRDVSQDEVFTLTIPLRYSGLTEVVFAKFSGEPVSSGNISLSNSANQSRGITVNPKGVVSY